MKKPNFVVMHVTTWICGTVGVVLFSQAISFAMPSKDSFEPGAYRIFRDHAVLLAAAGIGFVAAGILGAHLIVAAQRTLERDATAPAQQV